MLVRPDTSEDAYQARRESFWMDLVHIALAEYGGGRWYKPDSRCLRERKGKLISMST